MSSDDLNGVQPDATHASGEPRPTADSGDTPLAGGELQPVPPNEEMRSLEIEEDAPDDGDTPVPPMPAVGSNSDNAMPSGSEPLPMAPAEDAIPISIEETERDEQDTPVPPIPLAVNENYILTGGKLLMVPPDHDAAPLEIAEDEPNEEDTPVPPMVATTPPRIVAEAPLGGVARPRPMARAAPPDTNDITKDATTSAAPAADPGPQPAQPASKSPAVLDSAASPTTKAQPPEPVPPVESKALTPGQPPSRVTVSESAPVPAREDWQDDDLSPELAAVLFGERKSKAAAPVATESPIATAVPEAKPAAEEAEPPTEPIALTDIAAARRLRLTARGHSAAAPDAALQAKTRYVRVEEPLSDDRGQRITETWTYFKPNYPSLEGRLVQHVRSEEITYADGSWEWHYERRYSDRGKDRREVRASADRTYVERKDTVSKRDPQSGKRIPYHEDAAMILAVPERDEKRGLLGGLLGRDDDDTGNRKSWREATASERRQARKQGGQAFPRRFLGII